MAMQPALFPTDEQLLQQVASAAATSHHSPPMNLMSGDVEEAIIVQEEHLVDHVTQVVTEQQTAIDPLDGNASDGSNDGFLMATPLARRIRRNRSLAALSDDELESEEPTAPLQSTGMNMEMATHDNDDNDDDDYDSMEGQIIGVKRRRTTATTSFNSSSLTSHIDKEEEEEEVHLSSAVTATTSTINDSSTISSNGIKIRIRYPTALKMTAKQEDEGEDAENEEAPIGRSLRNRNRRSYVEPSEADLDAALVSDDTFDNFNATTTATTTSLNGRTQNIHANTDYTNDDHDDAFMNDYFSNSGTINRKESQRRTGLSQTNDSSLNTSHVETSHSLDANHDDDDDDDGDNQGRTRRSRRIQSRQRAHSDEDGDGSYMPMDEDSHHDDSQGSNLDVDDNDDSDMDYGRPRRRTSTRDHMSNNNNNGGGGNTNTTGGKSTSALHSTMSLRTRRAVGSGSIQSANYHDNGSVNRGMRSGAASKTTTTATTATTATARPARNMPARATKRGFLDRLRETAGMLDTYRNEDDMKNVEKYVPTGRSGLRQRNRVDYQRLDNGQPVPPSVSAQSHHHLNHLDHDHHHDTEEDEDGLNGTPRKYRLRARAAPKNYDEVSYFNSMLESNMRKAEQNNNNRRGNGGPNTRNIGGSTLNFTSNPNRHRAPRGGHAFMFRPGSDSDSDGGKAAAGGGSNNMMNGGGSGAQPILPFNIADLPNDRGPPGLRKKDMALADTDPLGVARSVDFTAIGGLDEHIRALKEMVMLPLLYPELFTEKRIIPPRGVIFHGPPGTGKTLMARALANSCTTTNQPVAFFMRKGADCLSKWVGEAERQLRLLFEAAKEWQPSIIFFDEIDGLAPVRSSRQDQIHASIVSTLLALMDGLDHRGQVVVIGATNRVDAIDPALRRPGRFDREFYFGLPNEVARRRIIDINTQHWQPPIADSFKDRLAAATKGYGGADIKALSTEAALRAIRRRYPQIYHSQQKLVLDPQSVHVSETDFVAAMKDMVPSSYRSVSAVAAPLPASIAPLLESAWEQVQTFMNVLLPDGIKKKSAATTSLVSSANLSLDQFNTDGTAPSNVFRPRLLIAGKPGMGQLALGQAVLQLLEGCQVCSFDLGSLMSETTRTPEAACVQLFVEAKRHRPSVLYIPQLDNWCGPLSDLVISTFSSLLRSLNPYDPILLLATCECLPKELPPAIKEWFKEGQCRVVLPSTPSTTARQVFFQAMHKDVYRAPSEEQSSSITDMTTNLSMNNEIVEQLPKLPIAPPPPPRAPSQMVSKEQRDYDEFWMGVFRLQLYNTMSSVHKLRKDFKELFNERLQPIDLVTQLPIDTDPPLDLVAIWDKTARRKNGYKNTNEFFNDLEYWADNIDVMSRANTEEHRPYHSIAQLLLDEVATSIRAWNYQLEERIDEIAHRHERLRLREEEWKRECDDLTKQAIPTTPHRRSRRLQGDSPNDNNDPALIKQATESSNDNNNNDDDEQAMQVDQSTRNTANVACVQDTEMKDADTTMEETTTTDQQHHQMNVETKEPAESLLVIATNDATTTDKPLDQSSESVNDNTAPNVTMTVDTIEHTVAEGEEQAMTALLPKSVTIDEAQVEAWTNRVVALTEGYSIDALDKMRISLHAIIKAYSQQWDRSQLIMDLNKALDSLTEKTSIFDSDIE